MVWGKEGKTGQDRGGGGDYHLSNAGGRLSAARKQNTSCMYHELDFYKKTPCEELYTSNRMTVVVVFDSHLVLMLSV